MVSMSRVMAAPDTSTRAPHQTNKSRLMIPDIGEPEFVHHRLIACLDADALLPLHVCLVPGLCYQLCASRCPCHQGN